MGRHLFFFSSISLSFSNVSALNLHLKYSILFSFAACSRRTVSANFYFCRCTAFVIAALERDAEEKYDFCASTFDLRCNSIVVCVQKVGASGQVNAASARTHTNNSAGSKWSGLSFLDFHSMLSATRLFSVTRIQCGTRVRFRLLSLNFYFSRNLIELIASICSTDNVEQNGIPSLCCLLRLARWPRCDYV